MDNYQRAKKVASLYKEAMRMLKEDGMSDEVMEKLIEVQSLSMEALVDIEKEKQNAELESMVNPPKILSPADKEKIELKLGGKYYPLEEENGVFKIKLKREDTFGGIWQGTLFIFGIDEAKIGWQFVASGERKGETKLGGILKGTKITEKDIEEGRQELLDKLEKKEEEKDES